MKSFACFLIASALVACSPVTRDFGSGGAGGAGGKSSSSSQGTSAGGAGQGGARQSGGGGQGGMMSCKHNADCAPLNTTCSTFVCPEKVCIAEPVAAGTACHDAGGKACDGAGRCVACESSADCQPTGTSCISATCSSDGTCGTVNAADGNSCKDGGGSVCWVGACVACNVNTDCSTGNVCKQHACIGACTDGSIDGSETDVDCGGGSCPACSVGKVCGVNNDCATGTACINGVCAQCTGNYQQACGSCNGVFDCNGNCTIATPSNFGQACGQCGGTINCSGACSVQTPSNLGDSCTSTIHCSPCGYVLSGTIACTGKCVPDDTCSCCGKYPC